MLIQFRFKNFKSFRDDTVLDFSAIEDTENIGLPKLVMSVF